MLPDTILEKLFTGLYGQTFTPFERDLCRSILNPYLLGLVNACTPYAIDHTIREATCHQLSLNEVNRLGLTRHPKRVFTRCPAVLIESKRLRKGGEELAQKYNVPFNYPGSYSIIGYRQDGDAQIALIKYQATYSIGVAWGPQVLCTTSGFYFAPVSPLFF